MNTDAEAAPAPAGFLAVAAFFAFAFKSGGGAGEWHRLNSARFDLARNSVPGVNTG